MVLQKRLLVGLLCVPTFNMNTTKKYDVVGIGSPLLDLVIAVDDSLLASLGISKGEMRLIDADESARILTRLAGHAMVTLLGGSVANTLAGVSALGGSTLFIGSVGDDAHGVLYEDRSLADGMMIHFSKQHGMMTGHAITFITPDGERSFATHLGAASALRESDILEEEVASGTILYLEGYMLEDPHTRAVAQHAAALAKKHGGMVAIDLSSAALIERQRAVVHDFVASTADIVFANEDEAEAFTGKREEAALADLATLATIAVVKLGKRGSLLQTGKEVYTIPAYPVQVVNTNGAGDMFAAGILYGVAHTLSLPVAGDIASFAASRVVMSTGARLDEEIKSEVSNHYNIL